MLNPCAPSSLSSFHLLSFSQPKHFFCQNPFFLNLSLKSHFPPNCCFLFSSFLHFSSLSKSWLPCLSLNPFLILSSPSCTLCWGCPCRRSQTHTLLANVSRQLHIFAPALYVYLICLSDILKDVIITKCRSERRFCLGPKGKQLSAAVGFGLIHFFCFPAGLITPISDSVWTFQIANPCRFGEQRYCQHPWSLPVSCWATP